MGIIGLNAKEAHAAQNCIAQRGGIFATIIIKSQSLILASLDKLIRKARAQPEAA